MKDHYGSFPAARNGVMRGASNLFRTQLATTNPGSLLLIDESREASNIVAVNDQPRIVIDALTTKINK
jgi:hypothetical protein